MRERIAAGVRRNAQKCVNGWDECDRSNLSPQQAKQTAYSEHQRNLSACRNPEDTFDYSNLTATEAKTLAKAEHMRNYLACLKEYGYCDPSRLTVDEARTIHPKNESSSRGEKRSNGLRPTYGAVLVFMCG